MCDIKGCDQSGSIIVNPYTFVCKEHYNQVRLAQLKWNKEHPDKIITVWSEKIDQ